jgi:aspartate aminotransferase
MTEKFSISDNVVQMRASSTMAAMQAAEAMKAQGLDVVDLGAGEPDFDTPDFIKQAAIEAMRAGETKYTPTAGTRLLKKAILDFYKREFGTEFDGAEVVATSGGKQAIFNAVVTTINSGDEVLVVKPYWVTFPEIVTFAGGTNVYVETEETDFVLTAEQVKTAITPRTKLLIINSPSNPSGRVIPPSEFKRIIEICHEHGILVISDECYLRFVYPPAEVFTAATLEPELRKNLCIAGSFSKTYAMTGWRVGYTIARPEWTKAMLKVQSHSTSHPDSIAQHAAAAAFNGPQESVGEMLAEYLKRRDYLIAALREIPGIKCNEPEGAFYAFPDVRGCLNDKVKTSADFCNALLHEEQTVVTDGAGFGADGFLRISYATSLQRLEEGVRRIRNLVGRLVQ